MQKKEYATPSPWQENLNKEKRNSLIQKLIIWGGIAFVAIASIAVLIKFTKTSAPTASVETPNLPKISSTDIIVGEKTASLSIIEYSDFQCPACAAYNSTINKLLADYQGKVNLVYRFFPLTSIHKNAVISGQAGYAAWKLGKFVEMKDELFNNQVDWESLSEDKAKEAFIDYAKSIKLDPEEFAKIMNSNEAKNAVLNGEKEAFSLGLQGTPSFFLGNKSIKPKSYEDFKKLIDDELNLQKPLK